MSAKQFQCFPCQYCALKFTSEVSVARHVSSCHSGSSKQLSCHYCNRHFESKPLLDTHVKQAHIPTTVNNVKVFTCPKKSCSLTFTSSKTYNKHVITHKKTKVTILKCETCSKSFLNEDKLRLHVKKHENVKKITCTVKPNGNQGQSKSGDVQNTLEVLPPTTCYPPTLTLQNKKSLPPKFCATSASDESLILANNCQYCAEKFIDSKSLLAHVDYAHNEEIKITGTEHVNSDQNNGDFVSNNEMSNKVPTLDIAYQSFDPAIIGYKATSVVTTTVENTVNVAKSEIKETSSINIPTMLNVISTNEIVRRCSKCQKRFSNLSELNLHRCLNKYKCQFCFKKFKLRKSLENHLKIKHNLKKTRSSKYIEHLHKCSECEKSFNSVLNFKKHLAKVHKNSKVNKSYQCLYCYENFTHLETLKCHMTQVHTNIGKNCENEANSSVFICEICRCTFVSKDKLETHMLKHTKANKQRVANILLPKNNRENTEQCPHCLVYLNIHYLKTHLKEIHVNRRKTSQLNIRNKQYQCKICKLAFEDHKLLLVHKRIHDCPRGNKCSLCEKTVENCRKHKQICHSNIMIDIQQLSKNGNYYLCDFCKKMFMTKINLAYHISGHLVLQFAIKNQHQTLHNFESVFIKSENMNLDFENSTNQLNDPLDLNKTSDVLENTSSSANMPVKNVPKLNNSSKSVKKQNQNICDHCVTFLNSNCHDIPNVNSKRFPHKCGKCGQVFRTVEQLQKYVQKLKDITWSCKFCKMSKFSDLKELTNHYGKYHKNIYKCPICKQLESSISNLTLHIKSHKIDDNTAESCKCGFCDQVFSSKMLLQSHIALHLRNTCLPLAENTESIRQKSVKKNLSIQTIKEEPKNLKDTFENQTSKYLQDEHLDVNLGLSGENYETILSNSEEILSSSAVTSQNCQIVHHNVDIKTEKARGEDVVPSTSKCHENYELRDENIFDHMIDIKDEELCELENSDDQKKSETSSIKKPQKKTVKKSNKKTTTKKHNYAKFICEYCFRLFYAEKGFKVHLLRHNPYKPYRCYVCLLDFKTKNQLLDHLKINNQHFRCKSCTKIYHTMDLLENHRKNTKLYSCKTCFQTFCSRSTFLQHITTHINKINKYQVLKDVLKSKTYYLCDICKNMQINKQVLETHMQSHVSNGREACNCEAKVLDIPVSVKKQEKSAIEEIIEGQNKEKINNDKNFSKIMEYECPKCHTIQNFNKNYLNQYIHDRKCKVPYKCVICKFECGTYKKQYTMHLNIKHGIHGEYICKFCHKSYIFLHKLENHITASHGKQ